MLRLMQEANGLDRKPSCQVLIHLGSDFPHAAGNWPNLPRCSERCSPISQTKSNIDDQKAMLPVLPFLQSTQESVRYEKTDLREHRRFGQAVVPGSRSRRCGNRLTSALLSSPMCGDRRMCPNADATAALAKIPQRPLDRLTYRKRPERSDLLQSNRFRTASQVRAASSS